MDKNKEEQESLKKYHNASIKFRHYFLNVIIIIMCIGLLASIIRYLLMEARGVKENEQLVMNIVAFIGSLLLWGLNNSWGDKLFDKFLSGINEWSRKRNEKGVKKISDLNSALHQLSQCNGVIVWDTIWGSFLVFMLAAFIASFNTCNKPVVLGSLAFLTIMLVGGHWIGKKIWMRHRFEKRIYSYTKMFWDIPDEAAYIEAIDKSIQRGVLGFAGLWMLTDEYMIGRLSDIYFEAVVIPRKEIVKCTFFNNKRIVAKGLPEGTLQCYLSNGKCVNYVVGRGKVCNQALQILNEQGIPWNLEETRYT